MSQMDRVLEAQSMSDTHWRKSQGVKKTKTNVEKSSNDVNV